MTRARGRHVVAPSICCGLLIVGLLAATPQSHGATRTVQEEIDRWLKSAALQGLSVGVSVRRVSDGESLGGHRPAVMLNPASGAKLITTAVALLELGAEAQVRTTVHGRLEEGGALRGPLVLRGAGDPKLLMAEIRALAQGLHDQGVRRVASVALDVRAFDPQLLPPAFDQKDTSAGYRAAVGAAASMFGAVEVTVHPGARAGTPPRVSVNPPTSHVHVINEGRTVAGDGSALVVRTSEGAHHRTVLTLTGSLGRGAEPWRGRRRVVRPDLLTVDLLCEALGALGVDTPQLPELASAPEGEPFPVMAAVDSAPLLDSLRDINTWSNNFMAEMTFKRLGGVQGPASFAGASDVVSRSLAVMAIPTDQFQVVNGSGLYRGTRASADALVRLLVEMGRDARVAVGFADTLARPGAPSTLSGRLKGLRGRVRAKTGTLDDVVSLSGYLDTRTGGTWAFSVVVNEATSEKTASLRKVIDRLITRLARH